MQLPPDIDLRKFPASDLMEPQPSNVLHLSSVLRNGGSLSKFHNQDDADGKRDVSDGMAKLETFEDISLLFAPPELKRMALTTVSGSPDKKSSDLDHLNVSREEKHSVEKIVSNQFHNDQFHNGIVLDAGDSAEYSNLSADYFQLMNYSDCELWASEFRRLASDLHSQHEITPEGHTAAVDALLLAAECYVNPFFMMSFRDSQKVINRINSSRTNKKYEFEDLGRDLENNDNNLETIAQLERKRDKIVLQILLEASELDRKYQKTMENQELCPSYEDGNEGVVDLSPHDMRSVDAITLVRQNQALLCHFLIQRLQKEQHSMHEFLMQSLVFLLHSATKLYCAPEHVIDIILDSAEYFNGLLTSYHYQFKEEMLHLDPGKVHEIRRHWMLLQKLVIASSGGDERPDISISMSNGLRFANLIPPSAWMQKIHKFSSSSCPLVRFLGWMAISRNAKQYQKERLFLASDLLQLTCLLSIFADELAVLDNSVERKDDSKNIDQLRDEHDVRTNRGYVGAGQQNGDQSFYAIYPDISRFFPKMKEQFQVFGEIILEAVGLQLRSLSSSIVPDLLCWFSDLCSRPFLQKENQLCSRHNSDYKGFIAKNAKAIILYILEAIVTEHMEALVPEVPRVVQVLVSLCGTSYCDVSFLDSVLCLLRPIISYSLHKVSDEENLSIDESCLNFESLCFDELFSNIRCQDENQGSPADKLYSRSLTIYILASIFSDLSFPRKRETLHSLILWADFATFVPTTSFHDYLCAFQAVMESCKVLLVENLRVWGVIPLKVPVYSDLSLGVACDDSSEIKSWFLDEACNSLCLSEASEKLESNNDGAIILNKKVHRLSVVEAVTFSKGLEGLISKLNPTIELCWKLHYQLAKQLTLTSAQCLMYSRCLSSVAENISASVGVEESLFPPNSADDLLVHWNISLEALPEMTVVLQENHCWEVAAVMLDCLLGLPRLFCLHNVIDSICSAIKNFSCSAPKLAWRLQTDKWLSLLFARVIHSLHESEAPMVNLLSSMLSHPEPEQRFIALQQLGRLVGQDVDGYTAEISSVCGKKLSSVSVISSYERILSPLVSSTWDSVVVLASSEMSLLLRTRAMALLVDYTPYAERWQLQSLLAAADSVLHGLSNLGNSTCEGSLTRLSLALIASVCLYSPAEDISLIPQNIWRCIESLGMSEKEMSSEDPEKEACQALCRLKNEGDEAKEVLANLTSVQSYFDFFSKKNDQNFTRELQRELEQVESGIRPSRREFSSSNSSRPRERYRERENGRSSNEGNIRTSSGSLQPETTTSNSSMTAIPTVVLSGTRPFSGQPPTILQSRDRPDECGSSYEENFEGSRDSGDTGSVGDPDLVSALDAQSGGFGSAQRHGSRAGKSRQIMERRERDGRREGKWERKH
ncbi:hypothetical protein RJ639_023133 [Escallonia herrerae]|uniref:Uncharacterized protein n=1 Tax=Escallonia herrerae TaxID=1293975 RepID=A0AA88V1N6_9ASTE|nr:hypothetical protein RJ639_023133 [Escallonia herrerae]